jgi:hypothetical protein
MASVTARGACLRIVPTGPGAVANLGLPSGGFTVRAPASPAPQLSVRRFADAYLPLPPVAPGSREVVAIPPDASTRPWQLSVAGATPATICPLAPAP